MDSNVEMIKSIVFLGIISHTRITAVSLVYFPLHSPRPSWELTASVRNWLRGRWQQNSCVCQLNQTLKDHRLSADMKLKWVKQPDGKIFRKEKKKQSYDKHGACDS